jgi:hypothetical protein
MNLSEEIELEDYVQRPEKLSAADISAIWLDNKHIRSSRHINASKYARGVVLSN